MRIQDFVPSSIKNLWHHMQAWQAMHRYNFPSRQLKVIGITGTDGKTTTTTLAYSIFKAAHVPCGMISTIRAEIGDTSFPTGLHVTTPDPDEVQHYLALMVKKKLQYAVLEVTSHGLRQGRVFGVDFDVAVITNITPEHLDQHGTFEQYRADKSKLFQGLVKSYRKPQVPKVAILNHDDLGSFNFLKTIPADHYYIYGCVDEATVWAENINLFPDRTDFILHYQQQTIPISLKLSGQYNVYNALAAACVGISQHIELPIIKKGLEAVTSVEGRMEHITTSADPFTVIVDFAHTPNALEKALLSLRHTLEQSNKQKKKHGRLIVVFGCAGERDPYKREAMGEIAGREADLVVVTSEDPRSEDPQKIINQVVQGLERTGKKHKQHYWTFVERRAAIEFALATVAQPGDVVDITGKGHEQSLCIKGIEYPWDDRAVAREILQQQKRKS